MKTRFTWALIAVAWLALPDSAFGQATTKPPAQSASVSQVAPKTAPTPATPAALIAQGKTLYRTLKFKPALARFEAALKLEPYNDEALGLAAITAFRLDNQAAAREYFLRRADLAKQKDSVKAYSLYRVALTYWRAAHDLIARYGEIKEGKLVFELPEDKDKEARAHIRDGLKYVDRALDITNNFPEAYNVKNLLQAEAALAETDADDADKYRQESAESLRRALTLARPAPEGRAAESADFSYPTVRVAAFALTKEEDETLNDPMLKLIEGGRPIKRLPARFPSVRPPRPSSAATPASGATSSASTPAKVKIEVLISTVGKIVFAHIISGRSNLNGAALLAARGWTFEPATFEGRPVQVSSVITFEMRPGR